MTSSEEKRALAALERLADSIPELTEMVGALRDTIADMPGKITKAVRAGVRDKN